MPWGNVMTSKLRIFLLMALAFVPVLAGGVSDNTHPSLVVPKESGLTPSSVTPDPTDTASFSGQVWVEGLLVAQWPLEEDSSDGPPELWAEIRLDEKEKKRLPWYDWPALKQSFVLRSVAILNPQEAVKLVFSREVSARLLGKKVLVAKVHGRFLLTGYETGVECDAQWAHARLISSDVTATAELGNKSEPQGC